MNDRVTLKRLVSMSEEDLKGVKYIVLDIDSTLVYTDHHKGYKIHLVGNSLETFKLTVNMRPYLYEFIDYIKEKYKIIIWTAAKRQYALSILLRFLPNYKDTLIWSREHCIHGLKDLSKLSEYMGVEQDELYLIDDNNNHFIEYPNNRGYLIDAYRGNKNDDELLKLISFM